MPASIAPIGDDCNRGYSWPCKGPDAANFCCEENHTMTTASPDDASVRFSDRIETRMGYTSPTERTQETDWSNWERWMAGHKSAVYQDIASEMIDPLEQRLRTLELELAQTRGALDVLRDGALDVLRDRGASSTDNVNETIDKIRTDFQEKVKEIELRLAETIGTVDVLRGKGVPGALHVRGTFNSGATYCLNDVVASGGSSWVALKDSPGTIPGPGWQLIASQGRRGVAGEKGERGPQGSPGLSGATIREWKIDRARYVATPVMSDGGEGPPLELRGLFEQFLHETR
jgi:hypothetical protein